MIKVKESERHELKALKAQRLEIYIKNIVLFLCDSTYQTH